MDPETALARLTEAAREELIAEFKTNNDARTYLLKPKSENEIEWSLTVPPRSLLRWDVSLQPAGAEVREMLVRLLVEKLNSRGDSDGEAENCFNLKFNANVYPSPVFLEAPALDFGVCVYGKQYNASFGLALRPSLATATHIVSVEVPHALRECVWVDQPRIVLNERQPHCSPKLSLRFESKAFLTALREVGGVSGMELLLSDRSVEKDENFENNTGAWDDVYVSPVD